MDESEQVSFSLEPADVASIERLWRDLEPRADINFYLSWAWIGAWIAEAGLPDVVLVGRAAGEVVCLGLFRRAIERRHGFLRSRLLCLHETGDPGEDIVFIEYNSLLTDRRFAPLEPAALDFVRTAVGGLDEISIGGLLEDRYRALGDAGHRLHVRRLQNTAQVDLEAVRRGGGDYLATLSANTRQQIRRALRLYEARGPLSVQRARNVEEAKAFFEAMGVLHERTWTSRGDSGGAWRFPFLVAFHHRLIETCLAGGGVEIVRVACGDTPIGYLYNLVHDGWIGSYLSGFAYEADNKVKPGLVSFALYLQDRLASDATSYDFLAGEHRYKVSLGKAGPRMYWVQVQERRVMLRIEDALRRIKNRVRRRSSAPRA